MKKLHLQVLIALLTSFAQAQEKDTSLAQKHTLNEVVVQAFHFNKPVTEVPASVTVLSSQQLQQVSTSSMLPALNTIPGVRMEERSPGSYRLSIRGSLLRSPFGVRNIKVYWNGIPLSDGGGNTYLNLVDITQLSAIEIIKGPAASMYGANTGGVVLLKTASSFTSKPANEYHAAVTGGSYGLLQENVFWQYRNKNFSSQLLQSHQQSDGYRIQSALKKDNISWNASLKTNKQEWNLLAFYTQLYYQTPGGITLAQMEQNPKAARIAANGIPGTVEQKTAIYNNTFFTGVHHRYTLSKAFTTDASVMYSRTAFKNPFITNFEKRAENNLGFNGKIIWQQQVKNIGIQWISGGEILANHSRIDNYGNKGGVQDTVQYKDDVFAHQWFLFSQLQVSNTSWNLNAGISANTQDYRYKRLTDGSTAYTSKTTGMAIMPRVSALYKLSSWLSLYALAAKGFSPPSLAEVKPSDGNFYANLQPEQGWNYEAGLKGSMIKSRLSFDVNYYRFALHEAIVRRTAATGAEYFVNAGNTSQNGAEIAILYHVVKPDKIFKAIDISESYSYQSYFFSDYKQGSADFSGKELTGVPRQVSVTMLKIEMQNSFFINFLFNYTAAIPLTDANDSYADAYHLLQAKTGYKFHLSKINMQVFTGADNLLNEVYSLGNDINAAGKRFFNPSPAISIYAGLSLAIK